MEFKDYYATLGVPKDAPQDEIQRAYRKLARKYHPDVSKEEGAEEKFKEIGEAHEVLKDPEKRTKYDRYGMAWKAVQEGQAPPPGFEGIRFDSDFGQENDGPSSSFFEALFGSMGGRRDGWQPYTSGSRGGVWQMRGTDYEMRVPLRLEEAALGGNREFSLTDPVTGKSKTYKVAIPQGVMPGQRIRLAGQGEGGRGGGQAGDLYLLVEISPHPDFLLDGRDLHTKLYLTPWEAGPGAEVEMKTLDGKVRLKVPTGSSSGRKIRLKNKGFPNPQGQSGDLFAEVEIKVPQKPSKGERALFEQLARESTFSARSSDEVVQ